MEKLIENNLFGDGLVRIEQPLLIKRYNNCLKDIGVSKTDLTLFHIDKWGWSPEVANEKQNQDYLCFGFANPFGIIISPEQKRASIYHPIHSFDWKLMDFIFDMYDKQIMDVTTQFGLWFELNQALSTYRSPQDLLLMDTLEIKFYTPTKIIPKVREQKKLVQEFYDKPNAWANQDLQGKLLQSAIEFGDLRNRNFEMLPLLYPKITNFYSRAFDGLYVLQADNGGKKLLIQVANSSAISGDTDHNHIEFNIDDPKLFDFLKEHDIIRNNADYFKTDVFSVMTLRDQILLNSIIEHFPEETIDLSSDRLKNKYIHMLSSAKKLADEFYALEEIIVKLRRNETPNIEDYPDEVQRALCYPNPKLAKEDKIIIWSLISKLSPIKDVLLQYLFDKNDFFKSYQTWGDQKQDWAISLIKEHKKHMFHYKLTKS